MPWMVRFMAVLLVTIGLGFVFAGGVKLHDPQQAQPLFAAWGIGATWIITAAGWIEVVLGALLVGAGTRRVGSIAMMVWMASFGILQIRAGQTVGALASATVFACCLAWFVLGTRGTFDVSFRLPAPLENGPRTVSRALLRVVPLVGLALFFRWAVGGVVFWLVLPLLAWAHMHREDARDGPWWEVLLLYLLVLGLGTSGLWAFAGHTFMPETVSASVGWEPSPFQTELAFYHLGVGLAGLACWWFRDNFWTATAGIATVFLLEAGYVHLGDFLQTGNDAPANWGGNVLFGNLVLPMVLFSLVAVRHRGASRDNADANREGGLPGLRT